MKLSTQENQQPFIFYMNSMLNLLASLNLEPLYLERPTPFTFIFLKFFSLEITVAILAQGTPRAVAVTQACLFVPELTSTVHEPVEWAVGVPVALRPARTFKSSCRMFTKLKQNTYSLYLHHENTNCHKKTRIKGRTYKNGIFYTRIINLFIPQ